MGGSRSYRGRDVMGRIRDADRWGLVYMEVFVAVSLLEAKLGRGSGLIRVLDTTKFDLTWYKYLPSIVKALAFSSVNTRPNLKNERG